MTFSFPSFSAALTSACMPPPAAAEPAVAHFVLLAFVDAPLGAVTTQTNAKVLTIATIATRTLRIRSLPPGAGPRCPDHLPGT